MEEQVDDQHKYKTKHAALIASVIGNTDEVHALDDLRHQLKTSKITSALKIKHNKLLTKLQADAQREKSSILDQIKAFEMLYFNEHQCLPNTRTCPERSSLLKKYKRTTRLLAAWSIDL